MIVLDASVLIAHFESADRHHTAATDLLATHASDQFASSVVTLAEVYVGATRAGQADHLDRLLARLDVESLDLPADSARRLGELRATTHLKMPDCCILYTAEHHGAAIATFDEKLADRAIELGLSIARSGDVTTSGLVTQKVTGADLSAGRIRIPVSTKPALPATKSIIRVTLRGHDMEVRWDPRIGPDRSRSGVLSIGRAILASAVAKDQELTLSVRPDGSIELT